VRVVVEADGGSRGNPGPAGYGAVVLSEDGTVLAERDAYLGVETNNVAEYSGLIAGLQAAQEVGASEVAVRMDSRLVVEQMNGAWQIKHERLRALAAEANELRAMFDTVTFEWIPRERNLLADRLANRAMDRGAGAPKQDAPLTWTPPAGTPSRLILVRHGSTAHSLDHRFSGRNDLPLDAAGAAQAAALAARAPSFGAVAAIVSSPLRRARQTADWIGSALGLAVAEDEDLVELDFGAWEGLTMSEVSARDRATLAGWVASPDIATPGGESISALTARVLRARDGLVQRYPEQRVVVVTHVTPIKVLVRAVLDAPATSLHRMHLDTASVSRVDHWPGGAASVRLFNDTSHLSR
jgi:ribonuclease H / adenosylcobalamin/alpha-ribazole phosphatase